jgi:hypothetical protein
MSVLVLLGILWSQIFCNYSSNSNIELNIIEDLSSW